MSREDLEDTACFCDKAFTQVRQLKDCLLVNFMQLDSILEAYGRAYHEDRQMVAEFRALKRQFMHKLIGQLEQCMLATCIELGWVNLHILVKWVTFSPGHM